MKLDAKRKTSGRRVDGLETGAELPELVGEGDGEVGLLAVEGASAVKGDTDVCGSRITSVRDGQGRCARKARGKEPTLFQRLREVLERHTTRIAYKFERDVRVVVRDDGTGVLLLGRLLNLLLFVIVLAAREKVLRRSNTLLLCVADKSCRTGERQSREKRR